MSAGWAHLVDASLAVAPPNPRRGSIEIELPPLSDRHGGEDEILVDNIRAVATIYFAFQLEQLKLIQVTDRLVELWSAGQLPITSGPAGKALYRWKRNSSRRMTNAARMSQFTRVLGAPGGEGSEVVQPSVMATRAEGPAGTWRRNAGTAR